MEDLLILVDEDDREVGHLDKMAVHQKGLLHRAFSVFIFNSQEELLLQQRADNKYHSAGLWSNTCCSHPQKDEEVKAAVDRRLREEMGLNCPTDFKFKFTYKTCFDNGLTEHEVDHVYFGKSDETPICDPSEIKNWRYISLEKLEEEINLHPENFSEWLKLCLPKMTDYQDKNRKTIF